MRGLLSIFLLFSLAVASTQNTVGVLRYDDELYSPGYNLFFSHNQSKVYLIDACGEIVHEWTDTDNFRPGNAVHLLENGNLIKCKRDRLSAIQDPIWAGGGGETIEVRSWDNELLASYTQNDSFFRLHHDVAPMPDGNILMILWENKDLEFVLAQGRDPSTLDKNELWYLAILEWDPFIDSIVWEWHASDHIVQDFDSQKENFGSVSGNPQLIDINYSINGNPDWLHTNSIDYNPVLDQIALSVPHFDELWIIDHSTTTEEAASSSGGLSGHGGDLLYRWGNPVAYGQGTEDNQHLFFQHDVHWTNPIAIEGDPGYGQLALFNNRLAGGKSSANVLQTPIEGFTYELDGDTFGPSNFEKVIFHPDSSFMAFSSSVSSAQVLENGNMLVHAGRWGFSYEITPDDKIAWEYKVPLKAGSVVSQGDTLDINNNLTFRMKRYAPDYPAFAGRDLSPKGYLELDPNEDACDELTSVSDFSHESEQNFVIAPNPVSQILMVLPQDTPLNKTFEVYDITGRVITTGALRPSDSAIDVSHLERGLYYLRVGDVTTSFIKQ